MNIVFRVDASTRIGVGHTMRCITLAEAMRARGLEVHFICREHSGNLNDLLRQKDMLVTALPMPSISKIVGDDYAAWLGTTQFEDAEQTIAALKGEKFDWLVVDHYGIDVEWEQLLSLHVGRLMVIDDLANRKHACDVLLDQNYSGEREKCYAGLLPGTCKLLVGPSYALLRLEYAEYRKTLGFRDGEVKTVLVFFGGSDLQNMTGLSLNALSYPELRTLEVDVVIGANNPHRQALEIQASRRPRTRIYGPRLHLADLMARADLSIGAGGATTWERMCLGLPSIVISVSDNQRSVSEGLAQAGLIEYIGDTSEVLEINMVDAIKQLCEDRNRRLGFSAKNQILVDGLGAGRIAMLVTHP